VAIAQLYLPDWSARCIKLAENYCRPLHRASRRPAGTQITASPDLHSRRRKIEVGLEHHLSSLSRSLDRTPAAVHQDA
jgi:hypothetical protein